MVILGALIGLGAAVVFIAVAALTLFGGVQATSQQIIPGFLPDRPGSTSRILALLSVWGPVLFVVLLSLLAGIEFVRIALAALTPTT